jgi:hypothetical protein
MGLLSQGGRNLHDHRIDGRAKSVNIPRIYRRVIKAAADIRTEASAEMSEG